MKIFELNKDQLTDPDKIKPGQVLRLRDAAERIASLHRVGLFQPYPT